MSFLIVGKTNEDGSIELYGEMVVSRSVKVGEVIKHYNLDNTIEYCQILDGAPMLTVSDKVLPLLAKRQAQQAKQRAVMS